MAIKEYNPTSQKMCFFFKLKPTGGTAVAAWVQLVEISCP